MPHPADSRSGATAHWKFAVALLAVLAAGWAIGGLLGRQQRDSAQEERRALTAEAERISASMELDEPALDQLSERAKELEPSVTGSSGFMATGRSVTEVDLGDAVTDDGDVGTVTGVRVVDEFTSANEERVPGAAREGLRWLVVGGTYRTSRPNDSIDACDGDKFVTAVFSDGTTRGPDDELSASGLPRFPGAGEISCLASKPVRGVEQPFRAVMSVPEGSKVRGLLVGDMRIRTAIFADAPPKSKLGWLEFDQPLEIGSRGDDVDPIGEEPSL